MKNNKLDIFEKNAEFFERFNNSLEDTAEDRHDRTRFTVTGLENKVEFAVTDAQGRIKRAENDAVDRLNKVNGMTNDELISKSVGTGRWLRESNDYGLGLKSPNTSFSLDDVEQAELMRESGVRAFRNALGTKWNNMKTFSPALVVGAGTSYATFSTDFRSAEVTVVSGRQTGDEVVATLMSNRNTSTDKNNVLHSGTSTPINTLNVSDMAQEVVDRDDITVTSGAVYRVIQELRAEIALLKGNTDE